MNLMFPNQKHFNIQKKKNKINFEKLENDLLFKKFPKIYKKKLIELNRNIHI